MSEYSPWDALVSDVFGEPLTLTQEGVAVLRDTLSIMASTPIGQRKVARNTAILRSYYGIDAGVPRRQTQAAVGREFGIGRNGVSQVLIRELRMLRHPKRSGPIKPHLRRPDGSVRR